MASASASTQITLAVKATIDEYDLPQISNTPNILTLKEFTVKLHQMATAVESNNVGRKFSHMHLIIKEKEYRRATKNTKATVSLLKKPLDVHPEFQSLKKDKLTKYKVLRNTPSALLRSQSPFIEIYLNLTSTSTGESTLPVYHGLISCQSVLLYLLSTFEQ
jgi:hypothetical protein